MEISSGRNVTNISLRNSVIAEGKSALTAAKFRTLSDSENLIDENCEDFFRYLERLGLTNDSNLLVIPSTHHYYYDAEDMKGINTLINLKQLNHIRQVKDFLRTISNLLPHKSNFVGCFVDNKSQNGYSDRLNNQTGKGYSNNKNYQGGIESKIPFLNRMYSFFDSRTNRYLTRRSVTQLLESCGFQIVGMTELNGLTYFCTKKTHPSAA